MIVSIDIEKEKELYDKFNSAMLRGSTIEHCGEMVLVDACARNFSTGVSMFTISAADGSPTKADQYKLDIEKASKIAVARQKLMEIIEWRIGNTHNNQALANDIEAAGLLNYGVSVK